MNTPATLLLWCVLQVTLVAVATGIAYLLARRRGASLRSAVVLTGLLVATLLIPLVWLPWPRWELPHLQETAAEPVSVAESSDRMDRMDSADKRSIPSGDGPAIEIEPVTWRTTWNDFVDALETPPSPASPVSPASPAPSPWPKIILALFGAALLFGAARLAGGYWSVRRTVRAARLVQDAQLRDLIEILRAELSCRAPVALRETHKTATAAATGWRRPVILLPVAWRNWTDEQTRAVLAHELAHIVRRDYAIGCLAQLALSLHFYHPLWQWLVGRLRLEQELAADALAAQLAGGRERYLKNLAELALRRSDEPIAWPARAFLPTRHTFLRRIEMLRDPKAIVDRSGPVLKIACVSLLFVFGLVIAGIRPGSVRAQEGVAEDAGQTAERQGDAASVPTERTNNDSAADDVSKPSMVAHIPPDALFVVTCRPREILSDPAAKPLKKAVDSMYSETALPGFDTLQAAGIVPMKMASMALCTPPQVRDKTKDHQPMIAIRLADRVNREAIAKAAKEQTPTLGGIVYNVPDLGSIMIPDERTVLIAGDSQLLAEMLLSGKVNRAESPWVGLLGKFDDPAMAVLLNGKTARSHVQAMLKARGDARPPVALVQSAVMLEEVAWAGAAARLEAESAIAGYAECLNDDAAERLANKLAALVSLGLDMVRQLQERPAGPEGQGQQPMVQIHPFAEQFLKSAKIETTGETVTLTANSGKMSPVTIATARILPAIQAAREAARRAVSQNNLKQIAIAFHNHHDAHGYLPPAVIEENGVKRSWRVEILPYLGETDLYEQYRKDESWDSEHNKKVLAKIPNVFRDPSDDSKPNSASYYLLTSKDAIKNAPGTNVIQDVLTLFTSEPIDLESGGEGPAMKHITDGTSNTIMVVEASRNVPWTKPEDIPVDPDTIKDLLIVELGGSHPGGFLAAFADGSVRFISELVHPATFEKLITPSGGEAVGEF